MYRRKSNYFQHQEVQIEGKGRHYENGAETQTKCCLPLRECDSICYPAKTVSLLRHSSRPRLAQREDRQSALLVSLPVWSPAQNTQYVIQLHNCYCQFDRKHGYTSFLVIVPDKFSLTFLHLSLLLPCNFQYSFIIMSSYTFLCLAPVSTGHICT